MKKAPFLFHVYRHIAKGIYPLYRFLILPHRLKNKKEDPVRFQEKLGITNKQRVQGNLIWFHAASVGESLSLLHFIEAFQKRYPHWKILMTSGTTTSAALIHQRFPKSVIHQYAPLDFAPCLNRFMDYWQPTAMIWVESELWPTTIFSAHARGIPLILLNMRLSPRSLKRWMHFKSTFFALLNCFTTVLTQTKSLQETLKKNGFQKALFCGNLKYASSPPPYDGIQRDHLKKALGKRPVWMAASTHAGEEEICLQAHQKLQQTLSSACLILAIRHPHRSQEVQALLTQQGLSYRLYSDWMQDKKPLLASVLLVDQVGLMGMLYDLSPFVLVAGSFLPLIGGHNILEPLRQNCVTLHGPHMANFQEIACEAQKEEAVLVVQNAEEITQTLLDLYNGPETVAALLLNGQRFLKNKDQIVDNVLHILTPLLETPGETHDA